MQIFINLNKIFFEKYVSLLSNFDLLVINISKGSDSMITRPEIRTTVHSVLHVTMINKNSLPKQV